MAVLVTGGAGYIGSHMALALIDRGIQTIILDDLSTGFRSLVPPQCEFILGDVGDFHLLNSVLQQYNIDSIFHFAARAVVPESIIDPLGYYKTNTINSKTLIDAAVTNKIKYFIFSSTAAVYGSGENTPVSEATPIRPISPYGRSKAVVEWMLEDTAQAHPLRYLALRYFNVAGADPLGRSGQSSKQATHLIKVAAQTALGLRPNILIYGNDYPTPDGTCIRDYIHVTDLIEAHLVGLDYLKNGGKSTVFNCAYGKGTSVLEVIETVKRLSQVDFDTVLTTRRPGDPSVIVADGSAIRSIGWRPAFTDLNLIVEHSLDWEKRLNNRSN